MTVETIINVIADMLNDVPSPLICIIIIKSIKIIGAAITTLMYMSINVSALLVSFSLSSLY